MDQLAMLSQIDRNEARYLLAFRRWYLSYLVIKEANLHP